MKRSHRDFCVLFNLLWYRNFPIDRRSLDIGKRATWNIHVTKTVGEVASILGLYAAFESGGRTDCVMRNGMGLPMAYIEWEWSEPVERSRVEMPDGQSARNKREPNELEKLRDVVSARAASAAEELPQCVYIGYVAAKGGGTGNLEAAERFLQKEWKGTVEPLTAILITYSRDRERRVFSQLRTYVVAPGGASIKLYSTRPALPWEVPGTRWACEGADALPIQTRYQKKKARKAAAD